MTPSLELVHALIDYNEWANNHVLAAAAGLSDDELGRELGASFDSVRGNLVHVAGAQIVWLGRWTGNRSEALALLGGEPDVAAITKAYEISHGELRAFAESLSEDSDLQREVRYRDSQGNNQQGTLWKMMLQVVNHGTHHRAETALVMTALGKPPRQLDYVFFELERS